MAAAPVDQPLGAPAEVAPPGDEPVLVQGEPALGRPSAPNTSERPIPEVAAAPRSGSPIMDILQSVGWSIEDRSGPARKARKTTIHREAEGEGLNGQVRARIHGARPRRGSAAAGGASGRAAVRCSPASPPPGRSPSTAASSRPNQVIENGWVEIDGGTITRVGTAAPAAGVRRIETDGVILPGLIDLHGHPEYNVFAAWEPPKLYANRSRWRASRQYDAIVKQPLRA